MADGPLTMREDPRLLSVKDHLEAGKYLLELYWTDGDARVFPLAVKEYESTLKLAKDKTDDEIRAKTGLADALRLQYEEGLAGEEVFKGALSLAEGAVDDSVPSSLVHVEAMRALGELLLRRFHSRGTYLDRATQTLSRVVELSSERRPAFLSKALALHAYALLVQYTVTKNDAHLHRANSDMDRAVDLDTSAMSWVVAISFTTARYFRFASSQNPNDVSESIRAMQQLLSASPDKSPRRHWYWSLLARSYGVKSKVSGAAEDLDLEINALGEATRRVHPRHPLWHVHYSNYAASLHRRFVARAQLQDLFDATQVLRNILEQARSRANAGVNGIDVCITNLAECLVECYAQTGKLDLLDEGISLQLERLERASVEYRGGALNTLAHAYSVRFAAHGRTADLEKAISLQEEALHAVDAHSYLVAEANTALAGDLMSRYKELGQISDVERAISALRAALPQPGPAEQSIIYSMLGTALCARSLAAEVPEDLEESIRLQEEALHLLPNGHSRVALCNVRIGLAEYESFARSKQLAHIHNSIRAFQRALSSMLPDHPDRALYLTYLARSLFVLAEALGQEDIGGVLDDLSLAAGLQSCPANDRYAAAVEWARQAHRTGHLKDAIKAYEIAIDLLPELAWMGLEDELRAQRLSKQAPDICQDAAACAIELGRYELAVELSERGRTIMWNSGQELRADLVHLREAAPELARELAETHAALAFRAATDHSHDEGATEAERRRLHRLATRRKELLDLVRALKGFESFLLSPTVATISEAALHGPAVILNSSSYRSDALIIRPDRTLVLVPLPVMVNVQIKREVMLLQHLLRVAKDKEGLRYLEAVLERLLRGLWTSIGQPVLAVIHEDLRKASTPRVWWCPTGFLSFLPIHACGPYDGIHPGMIDLAVSSYIPTLSALVRLRRTRRAPSPGIPAMLAICEPNIPGRTALPSSLDEIQTIARIFGANGTYLVGPEATVQRVREILPRYSWLHISSHGKQDASSPLNSSISLFDGPLTLSSLSRADLPSAEFAFLSACHSAKGTPQMPDESMHLGAGMMFAGYKSVVATSWAVVDHDAAHVTQAFYEHLSREDKSLDAAETAEALHVAARALQMSGVALYRWVPFIHLGI